MYCFVLHIGIYKYCTNNKETHKACAWFQHANTTKHSTWPGVSMSLFFFRKNLSADNRHSNGYELCPFSRWHLSILIRSGFHTVFALIGKETVSFSVQSHLELHRWCIVHKQPRIRKRSVPITREMCPIRAEISTRKHLGKCTDLLFVCLAIISFRQNYFYILPNFGDCGAKLSFFHYIINQERNNLIKHCYPPCTKKPLISEFGIYIKSSLCKWGLGTRGERCSIDKKPKVLA